MYRTAESVSPMHPDKICDRISDAILDECLRQDPLSRVAVEVMGGHGIITITGEVTTKAFFNARQIAQRIAGKQYGVQVNIVPQSSEIASGVDKDGAGDQGVMIGYACNENEAMIPQEHHLARLLCKFLYEKYPFDGKTQITLDDMGDIKTIVASFQKVNQQDLKNRINYWLNEEMGYFYSIEILANPAGDWSIGGFEADTGLTGRKLAIDNYGTGIPFGGGAFSGKDATKVDRSAAYMARRIAVDYIKRYGAKEVFIKLAYAIGVANPIMTTVIIDGKEYNKIDARYDLSPKGIIAALDLRTPQFEKTAEWGHFGNDFTWEK